MPLQDAKEEVRARLNIEDVIGEYVQLKRAGRSFKGLSPFSGEKTPSFYVSPDKNIWHDFSSNKGGDVFAFVMEAEGMDFRQALEHLARKAGVDLSEYESEGAKRIAARKKRLFEANQLAARYYQQTFLRNQHAKEYIVGKRQIDAATIADFQLGYAPDSGSALVNALTKKGFSRIELTDAGLTNRFGGDLYRGRMMIPLMDATGQVIGFTGRLIDDVPNAPKYLNTPQTLLYDKSRHIFGLSQAKEAIRREGFAVVVEGNLDVVSSHKAGVKQVVATAGTAMTEQHLRGLKRLASDVRLAYDGDKAGIAATERAIFIAEKEGITLSVIDLVGGAKDPDELIKQDVSLWKESIANARPATEWILDQYAKRIDLESARGKQEFISAAYTLLEQLENRAEVRHYVQRVASLTGFSYEEVLQLVRRTDIEKTIVMDETQQERAPVMTFEEAKYRYEDDLLSLAAVDGPSQELLGHLNMTMLHGEERQALAQYLAKHSGTPLTDTPKDLQKYDTYVKIILLRADTRFAQFDSNDRYYETARLVRQIEHEHKKQKQADLINQLRNAERLGDDEQALVLRTELNNLIKEIARGK